MEIATYWRNHNDYPDTIGAWDAFKAFLRGVFLAEINTIKQQTRARSEQTVQLVSHLEAEFIANPWDATREACIAAEVAVDWLAESMADRKCFFVKLAFYKEGEQTGRLLAKIVQSH